MTRRQKIIKYLAIAFAVALIISIISGISGALFFVSRIFGNKNDAGEMREYHIEDNISVLKIDLSAADFEIKQGDELMFETNHTNIRYSTKTNALIINEEKPFLSFNPPKGIKLTLYLPRDKVFDYVCIDTGAGRINIDTLLANTLDFDLGAGEMTARRIDAYTKADIEGGAGAVTIDSGNLNKLEMDMGIGELNLTGRLTGDCKLDFGIGEARLHLIGDESDYKIEIDKGIGEALLEGRKMEDDAVYGTGANNIEIDGGIGSVKVDFIASANQGV